MNIMQIVKLEIRNKIKKKRKSKQVFLISCKFSNDLRHCVITLILHD